LEATPERLGIRPVTAHVHIASLKSKLEARTREQAVAVAMRARLI
jgi:DNA-binding CsgD family transcriptional regulator